ncbi:MAG: hypothetical protein J6L72_09550 [Butyricicoccus sp.]|nr:hypothetical protein [Butyricicoccus sp.]
MTHEFDSAEVRRDEAGKAWLCLRVKNALMARNEVAAMKEGRKYTAEIKRAYNRRSGRANAYAWELMGKLAAVLGMSREEVYRAYIPDVGDNMRTVPVANNQQKELITDLWKAQGLGWIVQDAGGGWLLCYYGSSTYDTRQMGRLIDMIVEDCKAQGIETAPPGDILRWVADWKPEERGV